MELKLTEQQVNTLRYFLEINLTDNVSETNRVIIIQIIDKLDGTFKEENPLEPTQNYHFDKEQGIIPE